MTNAPGLALTEYRLAVKALGLVYNERLSPLERRAAIPTWWTPLLLSTPHATRRLRRWVEGGRRNLANDPAPRHELVARVDVASEGEAEGAVRRALDRLPPPALEHVATNVSIFTVGGDVGGRMIPLALKSGADEAQLAIVCADPPREVEDIVGHELAHTFLEPAPTVIEFAPGVLALSGASISDEAERVALAHREALAATAAVTGRLEEFARPRVQRERLAASLARAWGFGGGAADPDLQASVTRHAAALEADAALARLQAAADRTPA